MSKQTIDELFDAAKNQIHSDYGKAFDFVRYCRSDVIKIEIEPTSIDLDEIMSTRLKAFRVHLGDAIPKVTRRHWRNIFFDWRALIKFTPGAVLTALSTTNPVLVPVAVLAIINQANDLAVKKLSDGHGFMVLALFELNRPVDEAAILTAMQKIENSQMVSPTIGKIARWLDDLVKLKCVEIADGKARLIEKVTIGQ